MFFISRDNATISTDNITDTFPEAGVYVPALNPNRYIAKLSFSSVRTIDPKYLPEGVGDEFLITFRNDEGAYSSSYNCDRTPEQIMEAIERGCLLKGRCLVYFQGQYVGTSHAVYIGSDSSTGNMIGIFIRNDMNAVKYMLDMSDGTVTAEPCNPW